MANPEIREAFEAAITTDDGKFIAGRRSERAIRREAILLMKQVETVIENLPDQTMSVLQLYEEIAGQGRYE